jgi:DNA-binding MarR family transcriptional regulator
MEPKDVSSPDETWFDAWRGVLIAGARVLRAAELDMIEHDGIPLTWFDVLSRHSDAGGGLRMQELEERSLFTRSGLTRLVDRIEAAGLVERQPVAGDRRGVLVALTDQGRRRRAAAFARHRQILEREFGRRLTSEQHRAVADALWSFWHAESSASAEAGDQR